MVSGLFPSLTVFQGCIARKKNFFLEYCKMLIHNNTPEAQELQLPNATFSPLPPLALVPRHSTSQGNRSAH